MQKLLYYKPKIVAVEPFLKPKGFYQPGNTYPSHLYTLSPVVHTTLPR